MKRKILFPLFSTIMKIVLILCITGILSVRATSSNIHSTKFSVDLKNYPVEKLLQEIEQSSNYVFVSSSVLIHNKKKVSIKVENASIELILDQLIADCPVSYTILNGQIAFTSSVKKPASKINTTLNTSKPITITGIVRDSKDGATLPGASVIIEGTTTGTTTDLNGQFKIDVPGPNTVLVISYLGYNPIRITVGDKTNLNIVLVQNLVQLDEIVVVGYGTQKKESVVGAISTVGSKELLQSPQTNISNALVGKLPGVLAVQRSGVPGEDQTTLRIRGVGTFSGSQDPLVLVDGIEAQNYNSIDPNEIESMSILKDASATAVYGVRGANGVLIITTKRGKLGKPVVSITTNFATTQFINLRRNANSYEYAKTYNEALKYDSYVSGQYIPKFSEMEIEKYRSQDDPIFYPNTDWVDLVLKPFAPQTQINLNISGGTQKVKYFFSAGYLNQESLFTNTSLSTEWDPRIKFKRFNFRSNFDFDVTKRLTINMNLSAQNENRLGQVQSAGWIMYQVYKAGPTFSPGIVDGMLVNLYKTFDGNPLDYLISRGYNSEYSNYMNGSARLNYLLDFITKGFSFHATISYQNFNSQQKSYNKGLIHYKPNRLADSTIVYIPQEAPSAFSFSENIGKNRRTYGEIGFDYARSFGGHNIAGLILYNQSKLYDPNLEYLVPNGYQGIVGRVTYDYKKRYLAEVNLGYNGTENFAEGNRFGLFPAFSLGWVVTQEKFFPKNKYVTNLKIRGSYGEVGNDKIGGQRFLYRPSSYYYLDKTQPSNFYTTSYNFGTVGSSYNNYTVSVEGKIGNPDLTWERAKKSNIGIDLGLWDDKILITADVFMEKRDNILAQMGTIPDIVGISDLPSYNLGKMQNSGFDGDITYRNRIRNNFSYWVKANYTYAHNIVQFKDEVTRPFSYQYSTGQRYGQPFGLIAEGFYNTWEEINDPNRPVSIWQNNKLQPGDVKYRDVNGDGIINMDDYVPIRYSNFPEKIAGISFGFNFKGFDYSMLFQGATNVSLMTQSTQKKGFYQDGGIAQYLVDKSWTQERYDNGLPIEFPRYTASPTEHNYQSSTLWLKDASYIRLKNIEIGYSFSERALKRVGITSTRIYINGNNLLTWDNLLPGQDPEMPDYSLDPSNASTGEPYPATMIFNVGLNLKF